MAWEATEWACGHSGSMQLYGKMSGRDATVAYQAGRDCFVCWLLAEWDKKNDPRRGRGDLAVKIAENKGVRVSWTPSVPKIETGVVEMGEGI